MEAPGCSALQKWGLDGEPRLGQTGRCDWETQGRPKSLGFGLYLGELGSEGMEGTGWSATKPIIMSDTKGTRCCYIPWLGFPTFTRMILGQRVSFSRPFFSLKTENHLDASSTLFGLSWGQDMEMKLLSLSGLLLDGPDNISNHGSVRHRSQRRLCLHAVAIS